MNATRRGFFSVLLVLTVALAVVVLFALATVRSASAQTCSGGEYKLDDLRDDWTAQYVRWDETPGYDCEEPPSDVWLSEIKAGPDTGEECVEFGWDEDGWSVAETGACHDLSHVVVSWECDCATAVTLSGLSAESECGGFSTPIAFMAGMLVGIGIVVFGFHVGLRRRDDGN